MSQRLFSGPPGWDVDNALSAIVDGILLGIFNYEFRLSHHPVFVVFVEDTHGSAEFHDFKVL
jgi:hypothetical protein